MSIGKTKFTCSGKPMFAFAGRQRTSTMFSTAIENLKKFRKELFDSRINYARIFNDEKYLVIHISKEAYVSELKETTRIAFFCKFPLVNNPTKDFAIHLDSGMVKNLQTFFRAIGTRAQNIFMDIWWDNGSDLLHAHNLTENLLILKSVLKRSSIQVEINTVGRMPDSFNTNMIRPVKHQYDYEDSKEIK